MNHVPAKDRDIAMVFQSYALYPHMTVKENLAFGLRRRRLPSDEIDRRVRSVAEKLGLAPFVARKPHALSGGQRQRVALGRAIVRDPKVFLFDEPLSNLDASLRVSTRNELIKQQHELGTTTIYVTHDQVEAMTMGDRICIMSGGEVVQIGKPLEVYRHPANTFVARFLGNPPMNLLSARLEHRANRYLLHAAGSAFEVLGYAPATLAPYTGQAVILGVRPEDLYEGAGDTDRGERAEIAARVLAVEPLGAETLLMLSVGDSGEELIARIGRDTALTHGKQTSFSLDPTAVHLFDPATTKVIAKDS
jgi:multiple sugar transport system ATP-binding protein